MLVSSAVACSAGRAAFANLVERAGVVAQPVGVAADAAASGLQFVDRHPDPPCVVRRVVGTLGCQHDAGEIADQALLGQQVETADRNADFEETERLVVIRAAGAVVGVGPPRKSNPS